MPVTAGNGACIDLKQLTGCQGINTIESSLYTHGIIKGQSGYSLFELGDQVKMTDDIHFIPVCHLCHLCVVGLSQGRRITVIELIENAQEDFR